MKVEPIVFNLESKEMKEQLLQLTDQILIEQRKMGSFISYDEAYRIANWELTGNWIKI